MTKLLAKLPSSFSFLRWSMILLLISMVAVPLSTSYFSDGEISDDNPIEATEWTPETPEMVGWNLASQSAGPGETPVDLACVDGGTIYTNENSLSSYWTAVSSTIPGYNIRYVRQNIRPIGDTVTFPSTSYPNNYNSSFGSFGAGSGEYQARVRAFVDMNGDNTLDPGDFESGWSDYCSITYDPDPPTLPGDPGWATNVPPAGYQGDGTGMSDYVPCGGTITDTSLSVRGVWGEATDALVGFDRYERQVVYNGSLVFNGSSTDNYTSTFTPGGTGPNGGDGEYYVRVRAIDSLGNATISDSDWADTSSFTSWCGLTIDTTSPTSSITVTNSPTRDVEERVDNGGFESDLSGWSAIGDVSIITGSENGVTPYDSKMARIGTNTSDPSVDGNSIDVNILSQDISHLTEGNGVQAIGFWYNFATYEDGLGFDNPGFMVFVGDKMVHQVWSDDVQTDGDTSTLETTGWRFLSINVADASDPTLTLAFYSGNTGDLSVQSIVYVDNVSTNEAVLNGSGEFEITGFDNQSLDEVHYRYEVGGVPTTGSGPSPLTFSLSEQPDDGTIEYWATDTAGNEESHNEFNVMFDDEVPDPVSDLIVTDDGDGNFTLDWTAVSDTNPYGVSQAAGYEIKYSPTLFDETISDANWNALPSPTILNEDGLPGGGSRASLPAGLPELYRVHVDDGPATYYFGVRVFDRAGNMSILDPGSIANAGAPTPSTDDILPGQVVINEVMWMGSDGSTADEWIELRNMTDQDIYLSGWVIEGLGTSGSPDITLPGGATLPANGYYLVSNFDEAGSSVSVVPDYVDTGVELANGGEVLTLRTDGGLTLDETPTGGWAAGVNTTDKRSMERVSQPGDGTDPANWYSCDSSSCADAQSNFWDGGSNFGTPGEVNLSFVEDQIESELSINQIDEDKISLTLTGVQMFAEASYVLRYTHGEAPDSITDALTGSIEFEENTREVESEELYLGTCSDNGEVCLSHAPIESIELEVTLMGPGVPDRILSTSLDL